MPALCDRVRVSTFPISACYNVFIAQDVENVKRCPGRSRAARSRAALPTRRPEARNKPYAHQDRATVRTNQRATAGARQTRSRTGLAETRRFASWGLPILDLCCIIPIVRGLSSAVECLLAKEKVKGSNPLARSRRRSQVVRQGSAKALFVGSIPTVASHLTRTSRASSRCPFIVSGGGRGRWRNWQTPGT